jgi:hypothetical protein
VPSSSPISPTRKALPHDAVFVNKIIALIYIWYAAKKECPRSLREGVEQWREAGITTPVLVPLSPAGNQMNGLKAVFAAFAP